MKKFFLSLLVFASCVMAGYSQTYHYDVNGDGVVTAADITELYNHLLNNDMTYAGSLDQNGDSVVTAADVTALYDYLLGNVPVDPPVDGVTEYTVNGVSFKMISVEGGIFTMGATAEQGSYALNDEYPVHQVTLSSFAIGQTEVTQELWQAVMGSNPSYFNEDLQLPVEQVSWDDCQTFIAKLNQMTGKQFRLPTEAEWEYAARGGNKSQGYKYAGSNTIDDVAWCRDNASGQTHPVATKQFNELEIYDMSGNVWEWCQDWYGNYSPEAQTDPTGPATGSYRVTRGGCWANFAWICRVSYRNRCLNDDYGSDIGLRLAL